MPLLIAHRGDTVSFPENTLEAFLSAYEKGAEGIELDIHFYKGEIIVIHDYLFDRNKIYPKLKDILNLIHSSRRIEIEIKSFGTSILRPLKRIIEQYPQADFELTTSEIPLSSYIKEFIPLTPLGLILYDFFFQDWMTQKIVQQKLIGWGKMAKADRIHISFSVLSRFGKGLLVEKLHKAGFIVHSHIFDTKDQDKDFIALSKWRVDQCTFDNITLLNSRKNT